MNTWPSPTLISHSMSRQVQRLTYLFDPWIVEYIIIVIIIAFMIYFVFQLCQIHVQWNDKIHSVHVSYTRKHWIKTSLILILVLVLWSRNFSLIVLTDQAVCMICVFPTLYIYVKCWFHVFFIMGKENVFFHQRQY